MWIDKIKYRFSIARMRTCDNCSATESFVKFKYCSQCMVKRYCSVQCQVEDWRKEHKVDSKKIKERANEEEAKALALFKNATKPLC